MASSGSAAAAAAAAAEKPNEKTENFDPTAYLESIWAKHEKPESKFVLPTTIPEAASWTDIICDPIGFSQHAGECWNDALQQILLFTDGFKETIQPLLYQKTNEELAAHFSSINIDDLLTEINYVVEGEIDRMSILQYLNAFQARFINHYNFLKTGDVRFDQCILNKNIRKAIRENTRAPAVLKRSSSLAFSIASTLPILGREGDKIKSGGSIGIASWISAILSRVLLGRELILTQLTKENNTGSHNAYYLFSQNGASCKVAKPPAGEFYLKNVKSGHAHAMAFFVCGGTLFYYDDNMGVYSTNLPQKEIRNIAGVMYDASNNPYFIKKTAFIETPGFACGIDPPQPKNTLFLTHFDPPLTFWKGDAWKAATDADFTDQTYVIRYIESKFIFAPYIRGHVVFSCDMNSWEGGSRRRPKSQRKKLSRKHRKTRRRARN